MRLIDADEIRIKPEYMHDICGVAMIRAEDIARILNDMPTVEPESHWIPCSERLPEVNDTYLVSYEDASVLMDWFNGYWFFYQTNPAVEEIGTVIAWMPRPEPYQSKEE